MSMKASCRLFVIMANTAPAAVILRRGPSKWVQIIKWHTRDDRFTDGSWFHGRIYEDRCDVSPNGELFVYFVLKNQYSEGYGNAWTAVSRPPWLTALALWTQLGTYGGGGQFVSDSHLILDYGIGSKQHPDHQMRGLKIVAGDIERKRSAAIVADSDWSGYDQMGRVIYTRGGKLFRQSKSRRSADSEVADFTDRVPDPKPPPDWAAKGSTAYKRSR